MAWQFDQPPEKDGWVKYFLDGTVETGYDQEVDSRQKGWTRGRQDGMSGVAVKSGDVLLYLIGEGCKFWQSDDYEVTLGERNPQRIIRRIEQKMGDKAWKIIEIDLKTSETREFTSRHKI